MRRIALGVCVVAVAALCLACQPPPPGDDIPTALPDGATVLPNGRLVQPAGRRYDLGDFPLGVAVSPDGKIAVAANAGRGNGLNGGFGTYCSDNAPERCPYVPEQLRGDPNNPAPDESLSVVDLAGGGTTDVTAVPTDRTPGHRVWNDFSGGVAFSPDGSHLYATGGGNDAVYDFPVVDHALQPPRTLVLPSVVTTSPKPPLIDQKSGYTKAVAVTPDGTQVLVTKEYDSDVSVIDTATFTLKQQVSLDAPTAVNGGYLYGIDVSPNGAHAWAAAEGTGTLYRLDRASNGTWRKVVSVAVGDHPTAVAVSKGGSQVVVANSGDDTISVVRTWKPRVLQTISVKAQRGAAIGSVPNSVAFSNHGSRLYVALAGDDAVAVLDVHDWRWKVSGMIPTGWYPSGVAVIPGSGPSTVVAAAAKGLGSRYLAGWGYAPPTRGGPQAIPTDFYSADTNMPGLLTKTSATSGSALEASSTVVDRSIRYATAGGVGRSPHNPVPLTPGDPTPIKHVIYVVRENRTFDGVFGDLGATRDDVDADPTFELLAAATPQAHALQKMGGTGDRFFSEGEASVQGHWWSSGANVNDYVEKSWRQNYSNRGVPEDYIVGVAQPHGCSIFADAEQKVKATRGAFTYRDYGEVVGALVVNGGKEVHPCPSIPSASYDDQFNTNISDLTMDDRVRVGWFLDDVGLNPDGTPKGDQKTHFLRNFTYLTMPQDHTTGLCCKNTPRAQVAQNDSALGTLVQAISHSTYWQDTAIFVIEDDSADGADHVDGHRNVLLTISPYAKHVGQDGTTPGYVSHQHLTQSGVLRTIELILGLPPMSSYDQQARPLYDLFQDKDSASDLTEADLTPFTRVADPSFIEEPNTAFDGPQAARLRKLSATLDYANGVDRAGPVNEEILWLTLHPDRQVPADLRARVEAWNAAVARGEQPADDDGD